MTWYIATTFAYFNNHFKYLTQTNSSPFILLRSAILLLCRRLMKYHQRSVIMIDIFIKVSNFINGKYFYQRWRSLFICGKNVFLYSMKLYLILMKNVFIFNKIYLYSMNNIYIQWKIFTFNKIYLLSIQNTCIQLKIFFF